MLDYTRHLNLSPQLSDPSVKPVTYATGVNLVSAAFVIVF